jgi:predicted nucleic acid-binding protein
MRWYLDASVALHALLPGGNPAARKWLDTRGEQQVFSSVLLNVELSRTLRRERLDAARARLVTDRIYQVSIDDGILRFAAAIEPHVKTLDAIHLATCSLLGSGVTVASHDAMMLEVAGDMGLDAVDPLAVS